MVGSAQIMLRNRNGDLRNRSGGPYARRFSPRAPQQPSAAGGTTSTPWRSSRRTVAALIDGSSTDWAQPSSSATRWTGRETRRVGSRSRGGLGSVQGARSSIAPSQRVQLPSPAWKTLATLSPPGVNDLLYALQDIREPSSWNGPVHANVVGDLTGGPESRLDLSRSPPFPWRSGSA